MVDSIYRTRSLGVAAEGLPDQYADGQAAKVWEFYIGKKQSRTSHYKNWIVEFLRSKGCRTVLDVACGTGVDSIMLLEEGFRVTSTDASDKMLKYALKERWTRRKEEAFDQWVIEEANWLSLSDDLHDLGIDPGEGFDAVVCLGNSFAHLPDFNRDGKVHKVALQNFESLVKPGGILLVDHRNYDAILKHGSAPAKNIYYNSSHIQDIKTSNLYVEGSPTLITLDYTMDMSTVTEEEKRTNKLESVTGQHRFRLSYYPHRLDNFTRLIRAVFPPTSKHSVYGDFKPVGEVEEPAYYIHVMEK